MISSQISHLDPAMPGAVPPNWDSAVWVGMLDLPSAVADTLTVSKSEGYRRARLLVRHRSRPVAFIELDLTDGTLDGAELLARVADWNVADATQPDGADGSVEADLPAISVVICTRNRTESLRKALDSVLACAYPDFEVVIVDNASDDTATIDYVEGLRNPRVRVVSESRPGLAVARNAGVLASRSEIVAFTDDDVVVDAQWLTWLGRAFSDSPRVGCVTGLVPSGELRTPTQSYFEQQVHWSKSLTRATFDVTSPPERNHLFPFQVGLYGTGASFAMRRSAIIEIGGFDEALGVGSPTGGGEDIDMFVRVLTSGYQLIFEPAAIVWHRHREDLPALAVQARGYGLGLGAWLTKVASDRSLRPLALQRLRHAVSHYRRISRPPAVDGIERPRKLRAIQAWALLQGPFAYATARRQERRPRPLVAA